MAGKWPGWPLRPVCGLVCGRVWLVISLLFSCYFLVISCVWCVCVWVTRFVLLCVFWFCLCLFCFIFLFYHITSHHVTSRHITSHHITHSFTHLIHSLTCSPQLNSHHSTCHRSRTHSLLTHPCVAATKVTLYIICVCQLQDVQA